MSQLGDIAVRLRAAISIVLVWALMFGVSVSAAAAAIADDAVLKNNNPSGIGLFACFKRHMTQRVDVAADKTHDGQSSGKRHHCPCCLAATNAPAVLPDRIDAAAHPAPAPIRIGFVAETEIVTRRAQTGAANGARAPPR
ncbi:MAG: hypothetical protein CTY15_11910 [Methylocystis sp.]|nr:MAG: hypothetical protein CTY15_11910 [Methylocystis sp.]